MLPGGILISISVAGCTSRMLVVGTELCIDCICEVPSCERVRYDNRSLCMGHRRLFDRMPWSLQCTFLSKGFAEDMMPMDVIDFIAKAIALDGSSPSGHAPDLILTIIVAVLKEPEATTNFCTQLGIFQDGTNKFRVLADSQDTWPRSSAMQKKNGLAKNFRRCCWFDRQRRLQRAG